MKKNKTPSDLSKPVWGAPEWAEWDEAFMEAKRQTKFLEKAYDDLWKSPWPEWGLPPVVYKEP